MRQPREPVRRLSERNMMEANSNDLILSVQHICKAFPGVKALDDVSIDIRKGTVHGIVGENGAGKSTLMKILSGVYTKDAGTVYFDGAIAENVTPVQALNMGLSIIYQEFNLINTMSVGENIFMGRFREMHGMRGTHAAAQKLLESIGCKIDSHTYVSELSVSEKQMVEITKALSYDSKLIIMDEPSSSLTSDELKQLFVIIRQLKARGVSIIYISHKLDEIFDLCDTVTIMRDGRVIDTKEIGELTRPEMISKMIGRKIENEYPERPHCAGEIMLSIRNLNTKKLHDISFDIRRGEILGLVGLVGAGRTEIVRAIFGADKVKGHTMRMDNQEIHIRSPRDAKRYGIGLVPEDRKSQGLVLPFSVEKNISMAVLDRLTKGGFVNRRKEKAVADKYISTLGIKTPSAETKVQTLSGGNQQKCIVGRWMETEPRLLIMDEPTRGIDVGTKYDIYMLMRRLAENGSSVILISSELPEVLNMSNRVLTICEGRITGEFNPELDSQDRIMEKTLGL